MMRAIAMAFAVFAVGAAPAVAETVLIQNGRIITNSQAGVIENGEVLIVDGRIRTVGADVAAPRGARIVDASRRWVTPGAFAAMSQVGMAEIGGSGAPNDADIESEHISAAAVAGLAFDSEASAVAVTRIAGVTRAAIAPNATGTLFSGQGSLVALAGSPDSVFMPAAFLVVELGETGAARAGGSRAAAWPLFSAALRDAREYPQRYRSGQGGAVLEELDAEAVLPYANGRGLIIAHVERAADIRALIRFARDNPRLRFAIHGGAEAWQLAEELAAARIAVILDPLANLPDRLERLSARLDNAAILHRADVLIAIAPGPGSVDAHQSRVILQLAGNAVAHGLPWDAAFAAVTSGPATIFGVGDRYGRLAAGYAGDVVVWDGDPLEVMSAPVAVFIDGEQTSMTSRQTALRDRYHPRR